MEEDVPKSKHLETTWSTRIRSADFPPFEEDLSENLGVWLVDILGKMHDRYLGQYRLHFCRCLPRGWHDMGIHDLSECRVGVA